MVLRCLWPAVTTAGVTATLLLAFTPGAAIEDERRPGLTVDYENPRH